MAECITQLSPDFHPTHPLTVAFDAPHISSDGGALLLRQMEDRLGLSERLAALLPDERDPRKVKPDRREQVRQRL
jgi:Transposase DDE domain group 1